MGNISDVIEHIRQGALRAGQKPPPPPKCSFCGDKGYVNIGFLGPMFTPAWIKRDMPDPFPGMIYTSIAACPYCEVSVHKFAMCCRDPRCKGTLDDETLICKNPKCKITKPQKGSRYVGYFNVLFPSREEQDRAIELSKYRGKRLRDGKVYNYFTDKFVAELKT